MDNTTPKSNKSLNSDTFKALENSPLFASINGAELPALLACLGGTKREYAKNDFILSAGDSAGKMGVVLSGTVHIMQEDFWGNRTIFALINTGGIFSEAFNAAGLEKLPVSALSATKTDILLIDSGKVLGSCASPCPFHSRLIANLVRILAAKNVTLTQKAELLSRRTTREKLLFYLSGVARQSGSAVFEIPLNRQQLADFLSVDRSAMSAELSKMQDEGILSYHLNHFRLYKK